MADGVNDTMVKYGYPHTLIRDYAHWVVLLRPAQPTLASLMLAAKSDAGAFGALPPDAHAELAIVTADIEKVLKAAVAYERINYLLLMMVDPHVHFHVIPRYQGVRTYEGIAIGDASWPKPFALDQALALDGAQIATLTAWLTSLWPGA